MIMIFICKKEPVHKHQLTSIGKQPSPLEEQERKRRIEESVIHLARSWKSNLFLGTKTCRTKT